MPAESRQRAVPPGSVGRAGLRSGDRPSHNIIVSGDNAGSGGQTEADSCELVMRAAAEMDNPGILGILRQSPRAEPGVVSAPGQRGAGPGQTGAESGQSSGQARPRQSASTGQGSGGSG